MKTKQTELDECDIFGKLIATQLRALSKHGCLNTQHKIQNIMFEERMRDSYVQQPELPAPVPQMDGHSEPFTYMGMLNN